VLAAMPDLPKDISVLPEAQGIDSFNPIIHEKAWWCYQNTLKSAGKKTISKNTFLEGYKNSWCIYYREAARALNNLSHPPIEIIELPAIIFLYHFPEYPRINSIINCGHYLALVKRKAVWMYPDGILPIDTPHVLNKILYHLRNGGAIIAMIDHAFPSTHNSILYFLGKLCYTPTGLIRLACKIGASIGLLKERSNSWGIINFPRTYHDQELAQDIQNCLSKIILDKPERWLLWPNLNHRWV